MLVLVPVCIFGGTYGDFQNDVYTVALYYFEGNANDETDNYNGTVTGAISTQFGNFGQAYTFDGIDDAINTNLSSHYTKISIEMWVYLNGWGESALGRLIDKRTNNSEVFNFMVEGNNRRLFFTSYWSTNRGVWWSPNDVLSLNTWYYIALTYDASSVSNIPKIYLNGESLSLYVDSSPLGIPSETSDPYIIGNRGAHDRTFDGVIDSVRISNIIRSDEEIWQYWLLSQGAYGIIE